MGLGSNSRRYYVLRRDEFDNVTGVATISKNSNNFSIRLHINRSNNGYLYTCAWDNKLYIYT